MVQILGETSVQACQITFSGFRLWLRNVACLSSLIGVEKGEGETSPKHFKNTQEDNIQQRLTIGNGGAK